MKTTNTLYFYHPIVKTIVLMCLAFVILGSIISWAGFDQESYFFGLLGLFLVVFFAYLIYRTFKRLKNSEPLLILTEEELILNPSSKRKVAINWQDIEGYNIREANLNKYIEIVLNNDEKYLSQMYQNTKLLKKVNKAMKIRPFAIAWGYVKRKDRDKLVNELDQRFFEEKDIAVAGNLSNRRARLYEHGESKKLSEQLAAYDEERRAYSQINRKYFVKAYVQSLLWALGLTILFSFDKEESSWMYLSIVSFFIYPFAKVIYDVIFGFRYEFKIKKQSFATIYVYQSKYFIQFLVYIFSLLFAPFGILYLLIRAVYLWIKRRKINHNKDDPFEINSYLHGR
jgi:Ca2+/Na+ antiporter